MPRFNLSKEMSKFKGIFLSLAVCFCILSTPGYAQDCPGCGDCGSPTSPCTAYCITCTEMNKANLNLSIYHPSDNEAQDSNMKVQDEESHALMKSVNCADCGDCSVGPCDTGCMNCGLFGVK